MGQLFTCIRGAEVETISTNWLDCPPEIHEMIIDQMDPKSCCRFAEVSKTTEQEVKESNYYLYSVRVTDLNNILGLELSYGEYSGNGNCLEFLDAGHSETIVVYRSYNSEFGFYDSAKWLKLEKGEPRQIRAKYVREYLEEFKRIIRFFYFSGDYEMLTDFDLNKLRKLNKIYILPTEEANFENDFMEINKLLRIETVYMPNVKLTFDEIVKFGGKKAVVSSDEFGIENIKKYLQMWKNEDIYENVEGVDIHINDLGEVNFGDITQGLDVFDYKELMDDEEESPVCCFNSRINGRDDAIFFVLLDPKRKIEISLKKLDVVVEI